MALFVELDKIQPHKLYESTFVAFGRNLCQLATLLSTILRNKPVFFNDIGIRVAGVESEVFRKRQK
jgi:hypothetical protein